MSATKVMMMMKTRNNEEQMKKRLKVIEPTKFEKDFSQPMAVPESGIAAAIQVMKSGRLFRYCAIESQVSMLEKEFAEFTQRKYCVAVNSCSSAIMLSLLAAGIQPGDKVATNGFTFTALPSTIMRLNAIPILVESCQDWTMNLDDLQTKLNLHKDIKIVLVSHMRGRVCDMDRLVEICAERILLEDCAHGCGVKWNNRQLGYHGVLASYSTQSDKVINSGEGGLLVTDDAQIAAQLIYMSGAYERRYQKHLTRPDDILCEEAMLKYPNLSCRMSELTAAVARPLLANLPSRVITYNARYDLICSIATKNNVLKVPGHDYRCAPVGDHFNFYLSSNLTEAQNQKFKAICHQFGVPVSSFISPINARYHKNWRKFGAPHFDLPQTDHILRYSYDLKLPPIFTSSDIEHIANILDYAASNCLSF